MNRQLLESLKNPNCEHMSLEEGMVLMTFASALSAQYKIFSAEEPRWLTDNKRILRAVMAVKLREDRKLKMKMELVLSAKAGL